MQLNEICHGFRLLETKHIPEVNSDSYLFTHEKSGARLLFLANDDDNKVFSIGFRTPPQDDTGVAHVVEHSVLCGSRRFPLKEPFVELVKGSLNTFLNAMTFPDKTIYPVASRNAKDFQNLMDVYLDAVFYPVMYTKKEVLMQEGWHYEIENADEPLRYSGVVYNEMKGATSSPEDLLEVRTMAALFPDNTYHYESGGNPECIPELTQEKFISFHKKYYHPSNSFIYLYGDMDMEEKLAYLDEAYLSKFDRIEVDSVIPKQALFTELKRVEECYPVGEEESTEGKTFLSLNMLAGDADDALTAAGLSVLSHALFTTEAAPLRQALIDAGIGKDSSGTYQGQLLQPYFSIVAMNAEPEQTDAFYQLLRDELTKLAEGGLDRELLEASLNHIEFKVREGDFNQTPKGLVYHINQLGTWLYDMDPTLPLFYEDLFVQLREGLDNGYYEQLIRSIFLDNPHQVLLTLKPSTTMAAEREAATAAKLAEIKAAMSEAELRQVMEMTARLKEMQAAPDSPEALATIPLLELQDINPQMDKLVLEERELDGCKLLFTDQVTNGIAYLRLYCDAAKLREEDRLYAHLLADLVGALSTQRHSYPELDKLENLNTGGISTDYYTLPLNNQPDGFVVKSTAVASALIRRVPEMVALLRELMTETVFTEKKRIRELIDQEVASAERQMLNMPHRLMMARLSSYMTAASTFDDLGSLPYYNFLKELSADFDARFDALSARLTELLPRFYHRTGLVISLTAAKEDYAAVAAALRPLLAALPENNDPQVTYALQTEPKNEGLMSSSRVQYVGKGANFLRLGYKYTGTMRVLETVLRYEYFWLRLRVQGGAYGAFVNFNREGTMVFASYRDPNLKESLQVYDELPQFLRGFAPDARELTKYIIGTISMLDTPLTPAGQGRVAAGCYLKGITDADRQQSRDEILHTDVAALQGLAELIEKAMQQNILCVLGNEVKLKENKELFGALVKVMD